MKKMEDIDHDTTDKIEDLENTEYACPYCDRTIEIFNNNLEFSITVHSQSPIHKRAFRKVHNNSVSDCESEDQNESTKVSDHSELNIDEIDLAKLFTLTEIKYENSYSVKYVSKVQDKIFCSLCACDINIPSNITDLITALHLHIVGIHFQNILTEVKSRVECDDTIKESLDFIKNKLMCKICVVCIKFEDTDSTLSNILRHFQSEQHKKKVKIEQNNLELIKLDQSKVFQCLPEHLLINRLYMFMSITGKYYCQLCQTSIYPKNVLNHMETKTHSALIREKNNINESQVKCLEEKQTSKSDGNSVSFMNKLSKEIKTNNASTPKIVSGLVMDTYTHLSGNNNNINESQANSSEEKQTGEPDNTASFMNELFKKIDTVYDSTPNTNSSASSDDENGYMKLNSLFRKTFETDLPQIIETNKDFIIKRGKMYICSLCNVILIEKLYIHLLYYILKRHFKSQQHMAFLRLLQRSSVTNFPTNNYNTQNKGLEKFHIKIDSNKAYRANINLLTHNVFKNVRNIVHTLVTIQALQTQNVIVAKPNVVSTYEYLRQIFYPYFPNAIQDNLAYIEKSGDNFVCKLCPAVLIIEKDIETTMCNFNKHLSCLGHDKKVLETSTLKYVKDLNRLLASTIEMLPSMEDSTIPLDALWSYSPDIDDFAGLGSYTLKDLDKVAEIMAPHKIYLRQEDKKFSYFYCVVCKIKLRNYKNPCTTFVYIYHHFKSTEHTESVKNTTEVIEMAKYQKIKLKGLDQLTAVESIPKRFRIFGHFTFADKYFLSMSCDDFERNKIFFGKWNQDIVYCILCEKRFSTSSVHYNGRHLLFSQHFESMEHSYRATIELLKTDGKLKC